jgi:hypothetical protein
MRGQRSLMFLGLGLSLTACGGHGGVRKPGPARSTPEAADLPPAPPGSLHADGFGPTLREASLDAKRAVSEQLRAKIASRLDAQETEDSLRGGSRDISQRIRTESDFEHAELIQIRGDAAVDGGFVVRAYLDRDRAAAVYREEIHAEQQKLQALAPVAEKALVEADTARLLRVDASPGAHLERLLSKRRILARVGDRDSDPGAQDDTAAEELERRVSAARRGVALRLQVEGEAPPTVRAATIEAVAKQFQARGCTLTEAPFDPVMPGVPAADVTLRLVVRDAREAGVEWRYLGFEVSAVDTRSKESFFRYTAMPDFAKGGGKGWDQADRGLVKALNDKLADKAPAAFAALTCR